MDTRRKPRWLASMGALLLFMTMVITPAVAQSEPESGDADEPVLEAGGFGDDFVEDIGDFEDWPPSAADLAAMNAETAALVEALADAGSFDRGDRTRSADRSGDGEGPPGRVDG